MNINLTLIGQAIAFAIFVAFCMKFVWPPLIGAISDRQRKIADGLNAAEKALTEQIAAGVAGVAWDYSLIQISYLKIIFDTDWICGSPEIKSISSS